MPTQTSDNNRIRILCVDDSAEIRNVFELLMREHAEFETVGVLSNAEQLEEHIGNLKPNVVVLDLSMPGRDPLVAMTEARNKYPEVRFLVASAYDELERIHSAFQAGATGFLLKEGDFDQLAEAIREVAAGHVVRPRGGPRRFFGGSGG